MYWQTMNREAGSSRWSSAATDWVAATLAEEAVAVGFEPHTVLRDISDVTLNALFTALRHHTILLPSGDASTQRHSTGGVSTDPPQTVLWVIVCPEKCCTSTRC